MRRRLFLLAMTVACATSREAAANGRYPESSHVFFSPSDPARVVVRTTFGLLLSADRGTRWSWICDGAIPLVGNEDPMLTLTPSGRMLATTLSGLSVSSDGACEFALAGADLEDQSFIDLAADPGDPKRVLVFSSRFVKQDEAGAFLFASKLWETIDEGRTFDRLGADLDPTVLGHTVDVTKTDPDRIYVSAVRQPGTADARALLLTSKDHGSTWTETEIGLEGTERSVYIAGIDPTSADRVYLRTLDTADKPSRLLLTVDGGATFQLVYRASGPLRAFALSADGTRIYIGGPTEGILAASTSDFAFARKSEVQAQCLAVASDGLWACSNEQNGFIVAVSKDEGATFERPARFCDIAGPVACRAGTTTAAACPPAWPAQQRALGCGKLDPSMVDAGATDAGSSPVSQEARDTPAFAPGGGCDCRAGRASPYAMSAAVVGLVLLAARGRRRHPRGRAP